MLASLLSIDTVRLSIAVGVALADKGAIETAAAHLGLNLADILINVLDILKEALPLLHSERDALLSGLVEAVEVFVVLSDVHHEYVALWPYSDLYLLIATEVVEDLRVALVARHFLPELIRFFGLLGRLTVP